jgi:hypothetical protein
MRIFCLHKSEFNFGGNGEGERGQEETLNVTNDTESSGQNYTELQYSSCMHNISFKT